MEPISTIVAALAAGAAASLKPTAEQAVKDAYAAFRDLLRRRFGSAPVEAVEQAPASDDARTRTEGELRDAGADKDQELLQMAREILALLSQRDAAALRSVGVVVEDVEGSNLSIQGVEGFREGAVVRNARLSGDIQIGGIVSGTGGGAKNPPEQ